MYVQSTILQRNTIRGAQEETGIPEIGKNLRLDCNSGLQPFGGINGWKHHLGMYGWRWTLSN